MLWIAHVDADLLHSDYRVYIKNGMVVSPFHDIPLYADESKTVLNGLNMVIEISRWSNAKQEISKEDALNPIKLQAGHQEG